MGENWEDDARAPYPSAQEHLFNHHGSLAGAVRVIDGEVVPFVKAGKNYVEFVPADIEDAPMVAALCLEILLLRDKIDAQVVTLAEHQRLMSDICSARRKKSE